MNSDELGSLADLLTRHLAAVIAAERGFVSKPCPACNVARGRGLGIADDGIEIESGPLVERLSISLRIASGACQTCHGGQRVWSRRGARHRALSDRELINRAARESDRTGQIAGGDRPSG